MKTNLDSTFLKSKEGQKAEDILRRCVHCGFCNATCPTYQELSDERDGPRGRIYLIKQMLEGGEVTENTQRHLDRCLTCRSCETTCPSGVKYGQLLDIGRQQLEKKVPRTAKEKLYRFILTRVFPHSLLVSMSMTLARTFRLLLPKALQKKLPMAQTHKRYASVSALHLPKPISTTKAHRTMIGFKGCVQQALTPNTLAAARAVLSHLGIELITINKETCCGAMNLHLAEHQRAIEQAKRNIDVWWPHIENGAEAIVISASGCGISIKEYPELLSDEAAYLDKANAVAAIAKDLSDILAQEDLSRLPLKKSDQRAAVHFPCSLQHGIDRKDNLYKTLSQLGVIQTKTQEDHLCCGSAGAYSLLQPELSQTLLKRKLEALQGDSPEVIVTANIGCQLHLSSGSDVPVKHWIELLAERLSTNKH
ncbi:glycolate oxidase iron-sulfur subunit [Enterovibrio norvegicus FF-33]|uniref:glycolate oxidase subunit GlcF n=1 Tax=Enterovibrio norvegicus TaxID=188144 RepID=UPI0002D6AE9B|nr:glycolate oxidase subunit GlcF [Enterovibrio norvegicus]OEE66766.1 glycolate oxidase iron-sulfur subunit [Enterovibrio norvegicus FF-33]